MNEFLKSQSDEIVDHELYYLANCRGRRGSGNWFCGNSMVWWALNDRGYTCDIKYAKVFQGSDTKMKSLRECDIPFLKSRVDKIIQHHIDHQDLFAIDNNGNRREFPHTKRTPEGGE